MAVHGVDVGTLPLLNDAVVVVNTGDPVQPTVLKRL
jgi:hypothetical protein